jgi:hypothetical protein
MQQSLKLQLSPLKIIISALIFSACVTTHAAGRLGLAQSQISPALPVAISPENITDITTALQQEIASSGKDNGSSNPALANNTISALNKSITYGSTAEPIVSAALEMQTGVPMPNHKGAVVYNLSQAVNYVFNCLVNPLTSDAATNLASGKALITNQQAYTSGILSSNLSQCKTAANSSSNQSNTSQDLNINDLVCSQAQNASKLTSSSEWGTLYATNQLQKLQLSACGDSLKKQALSASSSSSDASASTTSNIASSVGNVIAYASSDNACYYYNGACQISNYIQNILPTITTKLNDSLSDIPVDIAKNITDILTSRNIVNLTSSYTYTANLNNCLDAQPSSYSGTNNNSVEADVINLSAIIDDLNLEIKKLFVSQITDVVTSCITQTTDPMSYDSSTIPSYTTTTNLYSLDTLLGPDTYIGKPTNDISTCSDKSLSSSSYIFPAQINAQLYIDHLISKNSIPNPILSDVPSDASVAFLGGGIGLVSTDNFASSDVNTITNQRSTLATTIAQKKTSFNKSYAGYSAATSVGSYVLHSMYSNRQNMITIPSITNPNNNQVINSSSTTDALGQPNFIQAGQVCTSQEIARRAALWRLNPIKDTRDSTVAYNSAWQSAIIGEVNPIKLQREKLYLLAEIREDLFKQYTEKETQLALSSMQLFNALSKKGADLNKTLQSLKSNIKLWVSGGPLNTHSAPTSSS